MAKLDSEMKTILENNLSVIATANKDGVPNVVPKGSMTVVDDETLAYSESRGEKTFSNIQENPNVAVLAVNREKGSGCQVKGKAELLTSGDFYEQLARRSEERKRPRPKNVVRIKIEEIYPVTSGMAGKPSN